MTPNTLWRTDLNRVVTTLCGLLLIGTAVLKVSGLNVAPTATTEWLMTPGIQLTVIVWELLLGIWLVSGGFRGAAWMYALGTFAVFAITSGYLGWVGQASCGCFGTIDASPWQALVIDIVALVLLVVARPRQDLLTIKAEVRTLATRTGPYLAGTALLLFGAAIALWFGFGSVETGLAKLRGEILTTNPHVLDFGESEPHRLIDRPVTIQNHSDQPVRFIGGTSDCSCLTTQSLPITIEPGGTCEIPIRLRVPRSTQGTMARSVELWTDHDRQRTLRLIIRCRILDAARVDGDR